MSTATKTREAVASGTWQVDQVHSRLTFAVDYMAGTFHGTVAPFAGALSVVAEDGTATLDGSARVADIQVGDEALSAHLSSPEFFDAERAPEITFSSAPFDPTREQIAIAGTLEIKGIALPVQLTGSLGGPVTDPYGNERINLTLETTVDRGLYGLDWNAELPNGEPALAQDVTIKAELALVQAA